MEIRPILLSLKRNKAIALLVILQVAITLAVLSTSLLTTVATLKEWNLPSGIAHTDIISVVPEFYDPNINIRQSISDDIQRINNLKGVVNITPVSERPFDAQRVVSIYLEPTEEAQSFDTYIFNGDYAFQEVMNLQLIEGRFFRENEVMTGPENEISPANVVMVSEQLSEALFPDDGTVIGKALWLQKDSQPVEIIGVYSNFMNGERLNGQGQSYRTVLRPQVSWSANADPNYLIRVESGTALALLETIRNAFYKTDGRYIHRVEALTRTQKRMYDGRGSRSLMLLVISAVLLLITALGMAGLVSFLVSQRQKQIGTRRALGATKWHIVRYFMLENGILTSIGIILGLILSILFTFLLTEESGINILDLSYIFSTAFFILVINQLAVYLPAKRAANVEPAIVTRGA